MTQIASLSSASYSYIEQAFLSAWNATCGTTTGLSTFIVPSDKIFLLKPLTFEGPCNSSYVDVQVRNQNIRNYSSVFAYSLMLIVE